MDIQSKIYLYINIIFISLMLSLCFICIAFKTCNLKEKIKLKRLETILCILCSIINLLLTIIHVDVISILNYIMLVPVLVGISAQDIKSNTIPFALICIGIIFTLIYYYLFNDISIMPKRLVTSLIICLLIFVLSLILSKINKKNVLGFGDIEFLFMLSLNFNLYHILVGIFLSCVFALLYILIMKKKGIIPFGPFISLGFISVMFLSAFLPSFII